MPTKTVIRGGWLGFYKPLKQPPDLGGKKTILYCHSRQAFQNAEKVVRKNANTCS